MKSEAHAGMSDPDNTQRSRDGLFAWYRELTGKERRVLWTCKAGYALDGMDTMMLSLAIPALIATFGLTKADAGLLGTMTLMASAVGGWCAGILSDRIGRVRTLQITVAWFALFTFACSLAQNFGELLAARTLMGLGFGGEWAAGAALVTEVIRARSRGKATGLVQSGWALGWAAAVLLSTLLFSTLDSGIAWRVLFALGLLPGFLVFILRNSVEDSSIYLEDRQRRAVSQVTDVGFWEIFSAPYVVRTVLSTLMMAGLLGGYWTVATWLPTFLKTERHLSILSTGGYLAVTIIGAYSGYVTSAYLNDLIGRRGNFILFAVCCMLVVVAYTLLPIGNDLMLMLGFPLGFFSSGIFSGTGAFLGEMFPTRIRGSGQGFCYSAGRGISASLPFLIGYATSHMSLGNAIGIFATACYGLVIVAALALPETRGKQLES